ncbi:MAG: GNAT family N-acetyltransferase [Janthinobacterium lividum]
MALKIRPAGEADHLHWLALWQQYCLFYETSLSDEVTAQTWQRIITPGEPIHSLIALDDAGHALGICNYVCHPNTWSSQQTCYLEDLYVSPDARRQGVAQALIGALTRLGREQHWLRIYWITHDDNAPARALYDAVAKNTGHTRYEIALTPSS